MELECVLLGAAKGLAPTTKAERVKEPFLPPPKVGVRKELRYAHPYDNVNKAKLTGFSRNRISKRDMSTAWFVVATMKIAAR
jgi:hypothetical protein